MIEAQGLTKYFGRFIAVENATFSVPPGRVTAFLGPNGAGKSTTMKMLTGYLAPSAGTAQICGISIKTDRIEALKRLGYLPENGPLYEEMTPREMLQFLGRAREIDKTRLAKRIGEVSEQCSLAQIIDRPIHKLSKGNRQRVGLAQALLHEPEVLILDEPTSGLDPNQIRAMRGLIRDFGAGHTVLLSTHILQEVEAVADHVVFIHAGRVVFDGSVADLKRRGSNLDVVFSELTSDPEPESVNQPAVVAAVDGGAE